MTSERIGKNYTFDAVNCQLGWLIPQSSETDMSAQKQRRLTPEKGLPGRLKHSGKLLHNCVQLGDYDTLKWVLKFEKALNDVNHKINSLTPLMVAAKKGSFDCAKYLLWVGASILPKDSEGSMAPWILARGENHKELGDYLEQAYREFCLTGMCRDHCAYLIYKLCKKLKLTDVDLECLRGMLQQFGGGLLNEENLIDNEPPLIVAFKSCNADAVHCLITEFNADVYVRDLDDQSTLHLAIQAGMGVRFLITDRAPALLVAPDGKRRLPFFIACLANDWKYVKWLFDKLKMPERLISVSSIQLPDETSSYDGSGEGIPVGDCCNDPPPLPVIQLTVPSKTDAEAHSLASFPPEPTPLKHGEGQLLKRSHSRDLEKPMKDCGDNHPLTSPPLGSETGRSSRSSLELNDVSLDVCPSPNLSQSESNDNVWELLDSLGSKTDLVNFIQSIDICKADINEETVFHILARNGHHGLLKLILAQAKVFGFKVSPQVFIQYSSPSNGSCTPLHCAVRNNHPRCVELMLSEILNVLQEISNPALTDKLRKLCLIDIAIKRHHIPALKVLVQFGWWYELKDKKVCAQSFTGPIDGTLLVMALYTIVSHLQALAMDPGSQAARSSCISWEGMGLPNLSNPLLLPVVHEMLQYGDMLLTEQMQGSISERLDDPHFLRNIGTKCVQTVDRLHQAGPSVLPLEQCAALTHITKINLSQNNLKSVPFELFALPNLESLSLSKNYLTHLPTRPSVVNEMGLLEDDTAAEKAAHVEHYQCHKLCELCIDNNILHTLPPTLFQLCNLEILDASCNDLTYLPLQLWLAPKLKTLQLHHNQLSQLHCLSHEFQVNCDIVMDVSLYHWCGEVSPRLERLVREEERLDRQAEEEQENETSLTSTYLPSPADSAETMSSVVSTPEDQPKRRSWFLISRPKRPQSGISSDSQEIMEQVDSAGLNSDLQFSPGASSFAEEELFQGAWSSREEGPLEVSNSSTSAAFPPSLISWNASKKLKEFCQFLHEAIGGDNLEGVDGAQVSSVTADRSAEDDHSLTHTHRSSGGGLLTMWKQQQWLRTASQPTNIESNSGSMLDEGLNHTDERSDDLVSLASGARDGQTPHSKPIPPLETLDLAHNHFSTVPWDLTCLAPNLEKINLSHNCITTVNCIKDFPSRVKQINLSHNEIQEAMEDKHQKGHCACGHFVMQLLNHILQQEPFACKCEHRQHTSLPQLTKLDLSSNKLPFFPISSEDLPVSKGEERIEVVFMPSLSILDLSHNMQMTCLSTAINKLSLLLQLTLSYTDLSSLPTQLGLCPKLLIVELDHVVTHLPAYLQKAYLPPGGSVRKLCQVLKDSHVNSKPYHRIRLMVVGDSNKGKTTLVTNLSKRYLVHRQKKLRLDLDGRPLSTEGVDILDWEYRKGGKSQTSVTFYTWDFGGQKEYYATHQVFFSKRSLYLLVFDVTDGEEGIYGLKRWLENIEAKASGSPVMVVGTHLDTIPGPQRPETIERLKSLFAREYLNQTQETMSLRVDPHLRLVNTLESANVQSVRDAIYDCALSYCPSLSRSGEHGQVSMSTEEASNLSEFRVPALYIEMERIVRNLANVYRKDSRVPILNRETFVSAILKDQPHYDEYDVHQGTLFLHDNGILLHFPEASLSDLYFIDPQWLSTVLAKVISIPELRRYHRNGFMKTIALDLIFANDQVLSKQHYQDIIGLMQKFEVALILDDQQILIPTLLPSDEYDAQGVYPKGGFERTSHFDMYDSLVFQDISVAEIASAATWKDTRVRHFIVPFVPNGFFPRLVARIIASGLALRMANCLAEGMLSSRHTSNSLHWYCWCHGFTLVWRHTEILRITQVSYNLPGTKSMTLLRDMSREQPANNCAIEVEVAMLPKDVFCNDNFLQGRESILQKLHPDMKESTDEQTMGWQLAAWLLNSVTEHTHSVFEDWYPQFAWGKESGKASIVLADVCPSCLTEIRPARINYQQSQKKKPRNQIAGATGSQTCAKQPNMKTQSDEDRAVSCFALTYSAYASSCGKNLVCQQHGSIPVGSVAPDVEFKDIYYRPVSSYCEVKKTRKLGEGAYGSVYLGTISNQGISLNVAIKELTGGAGPDMMTETEENQQWIIYQNASTEARIMSELKHKHILGLVGLTLHPWCLLLEYAPEGDLKWHIKQYAASRLHFGQRILLQVMKQIASAVDYLHSMNIIYRDLKPSNVLVWRFPKPSNQWKDDAEVLLKIADYGISKHGTPWGTTGREGTPAFQPPEAHRPGMELFVTSKFDVYSYGIVLYCIYSGKSPFENYRGPISSVVNSGVRPDILVKDLPRLQGMFELMCWCWGQKPQHRPPFSEILTVMKKPLFHRLLLAEEVSTNNHVVTAACFRQMDPPVRLGHRRLASGSNLLNETESQRISILDGDDKRQHTRVTISSSALAIPHSEHRRCSMSVLDTEAASLPPPSRLHRMPVSESDLNKVFSSLNLDKPRPRPEQEEGKSQLWFATTNGSICVKDCIKGTIETIAPVPTMVQSMLVVQDQVWCGFLKSGICVYHADSHKCIAKGALDRTITQLLYNPYLRVVYAFTHNGEILHFGDLAGLSNQAESKGRPVDLPSERVTPLEKRQPFECAVLVPCTGGPMIWCYVPGIRQILVLDHITLKLRSTLSLPRKNTQRIAVQPAFKMIWIEAEGKELASGKEPDSFVLLLDYMRVVKYSVKTCSYVAVVDLKHHSLAQGMPADEEAVDYLTSLEKVGRYVYAGSVSGVIWSIDPEKMREHDEVIRPFRSRVSCLLCVKGIGKRHKQEDDHIEWRERAGLAPYPLRGLQQSEEYLVAFGEDYQPVYHDSAFKPSRTQLLVPRVLDADELPVSDSLRSLSASAKVQRSAPGSTDNHCHVAVVDVKSPCYF